MLETKSNLVMIDRAMGAGARGKGAAAAHQAHEQTQRPARRRVAASFVLPAALALALGAVTVIPLPARAASLGTDLAARVSASGAASGADTTVALRQAGTATVRFSGALQPSASRSVVTLTLGQASGSGTTTLGSMMLRAGRIFNAQPTALSALFAQFHVTPQTATRYTIAVSSGSATLASAAVTFTR